MGETDIETMGNVTLAKYDFDDETFNEVSEDALNFITHLLVKETDKRMTATESLQHQWLRRQQPPNKRAQLTTRTSQIEIPKVQLSADLSPVVHCEEEVSEKSDDHEFITDNDIDDSTLSSDSEFGLPPPPPLPKTAPPPIELLIESSLPIIISTPPPAHKSELPPPPPLPSMPPPPAIKPTTMLIGEPDDQLLARDETHRRLATDRVIKTQSHFEFSSLIQSSSYSCLIKLQSNGCFIALFLCFLIIGLCFPSSLTGESQQCPFACTNSVKLFCSFSVHFRIHRSLPGPVCLTDWMDTLLWP